MRMALNRCGLIITFTTSWIVRYPRTDKIFLCKFRIKINLSRCFCWKRIEVLSLEDDHQFRETQCLSRDALTNVLLLFSRITIRKYQIEVFQPGSFWCVPIRKCIIVRQTHWWFCLDLVSTTLRLQRSFQSYTYFNSPSTVTWSCCHCFPTHSQF